MTREAMPALLTGKYFAEVSRVEQKWPLILPDNIMMAEMFKDAGYQTWAMSSFGYFVPFFGYGQGFDEYDDKIVDAFDAMKTLLTQQQKVIAELRSGGQQDWIAEKMSALESLTGGDVAKTEAVRRKFNVLKAGYDAAGEDIGKDALFDEAAKLVLGDEMVSAQIDAKRKAAKKRRGQHIARTTHRRAAAQGNPLDEVAAEIDRKFFKR